MEGGFVLAHLEKFTRGQIGGLTRHFERYKKADGEYIKFGNQEIDLEKTKLNYNLAEEKNQMEFIKNRTAEVRCLNRKDVNVMCDWVVTLPEKIETQEDQELFFKESYKFLEDKYGKDNIISSWVHLDETTPHMHFAFVPVVTDRKRGDLKVSANDLITRNHLRSFHPQLENHMKEVFGRDIGVLNEATKEGNKAIDELKRGTALEKLEDLNKDIEKKIAMVKHFNKEYPKLLAEKQKELDEVMINSFNMKAELKDLRPQKEKLQEEIEKFNKDKNDLVHQLEMYKDKYNEYQELLNRLSKVQNEFQHINDSLIPLKAEYEARRAFISKANEISDVSMSIPSYAEIIEKGLFKKEQFVQVPIEKWQAKHISANQISVIKRQHEEFEREIAYFKNLPGEVKNLQNENFKLKRDIRAANQSLEEIKDRFNAVFEENPNLAKEFLETEKHLEEINQRYLENEWDMEI